MACLNMYNNDQQGGIHSTMGPRISFSNDFADSQYPIKHENSYREAPVSSDFEFSVSGYNMIPADEVFFKGKLMPTKNSATKTTIRDELLADDDGDDDLTDGASPRVTKGLSRWKERLGLKRSHIHHVPRKSFDKINVPHELVLQSIDETTTTFSFGEH